MESNILTWISIIALILFMGLACVIWMEWERYQIRKAVVGKVLCEFITEIGTSYEELHPIIGNFVVVPKKDSEGKVIKGETVKYFIGKEATNNVKYPSQGPLTFLAAVVKKAIFYEGHTEPAVKRGNKQIGTPALIANTMDEGFTALALAASKQIQELEDKLTQVINPMVLYVLIGISVAASGVAVYFVYQMYSSLEVIKAGIGVQ
ncbi:hypothetical protein LCGC14_0721250 [marine sediment metagenome]|uniref:Uncharacterized protein n=1 Tax=marine sediment metagenome TaxID=412755 RepID=A0A0F9QCD4_9ZZZZ